VSDAKDDTITLIGTGSTSELNTNESKDWEIVKRNNILLLVLFYLSNLNIFKTQDPEKANSKK
jgi:hypothetical protein